MAIGIGCEVVAPLGAGYHFELPDSARLFVARFKSGGISVNPMALAMARSRLGAQVAAGGGYVLGAG